MPVQLDKIKGLLPADVTRLQRHYVTVDDLWAGVGSDFDEGIKQVAEETEVKEEVITALLIADSLDRLNLKYRWLSSFRNQHAQAYKLIKTLAIIVAFAGFAYLSYWLSSKIDFPQQIVVANAKGIPAYRVITQEDITSKRVLFRRGETISDPAAVIGSYPLTKLNHNARIQQGQILPVAESQKLSGRYIVSVPVKASSLVLAPKPGNYLALLPLPDPEKKKEPATSVTYAVLLGVEQGEGGPTVVVAVDNVTQINALLGGATIVGVVPVPEVKK